MKKSFVVLVLAVIVLIAACSSVPVVDREPATCNSVVAMDQFFIDHDGEIVTFWGVYNNASVYVFGLNNKLICATTSDQKTDENKHLYLVQRTIAVDGQVFDYSNPIFDETFNGFIGFKGRAFVDDPKVGWDLINEDPIKIVARPENCKVLDNIEIKQFDGKAVDLVQIDNLWDDFNAGYKWRRMSFRYEEQDYCFDSGTLTVTMTVKDVTGKEVVVNDPEWGGSTWFVQERPVTLGFYEGQPYIENGETVKNGVLTMHHGNKTENTTFGTIVYGK